MKTQLSVLAIATAAALFAAPAFADDSTINTTTTLTNNLYVGGSVSVSGNIRVDGESAATVEQDQATSKNVSDGDSDQTARVNGDVLRGADGNIGLNVSAGVGNAQANDASISALRDEGEGKGSKKAASMATAMVFSSQTAYDNYAASDEGNDYEAELGGNALMGVTGNVGVNVAAGVGNGQTNALAAGVAEGAMIAKAGADSEQYANLNKLDATCDTLDLTAHIGGDALRNASGNIGVNVASGVGNLQHNGLAIATGR